MKKTKKVTAPKAAQTLSKDMKQLIGVMIEKALKPSHKQLSALEKTLKALKMDKGAPKKAQAKKTMKVASKSKAPVKAKSKKIKMLKDLKPKA